MRRAGEPKPPRTKPCRGKAAKNVRGEDRSKRPHPFRRDEMRPISIFLVTHERYERIVIVRLRFASSFLAATLLFSGAVRASMTAAEVRTVIAQAASVAGIISPGTVIAVADREGFVLGVWSILPNPSSSVVANAIAKAGTAAYLSSDQHAFSSRT